MNKLEEKVPGSFLLTTDLVQVKLINWQELKK
jgi:hypothetical protein